MHYVMNPYHKSGFVHQEQLNSFLMKDDSLTNQRVTIVS